MASNGGLMDVTDRSIPTTPHSNTSVTHSDKKKKRKKHRSKERSREESETGSHERPDSEDTMSHGSSGSRSSKSGPGKKTMLKYMIHEVRELRRQLDPNAKDLSTTRSKKSSNESESLVFGLEVDDGKIQVSQTVNEHHQVASTTDSGHYVVDSKKKDVMVKKHSSSVDAAGSPSRKKRLLPKIPHQDGRDRQMLNTYPPVARNTTTTPDIFQPISPAPLTSTAPTVLSAFHPITKVKSPTSHLLGNADLGIDKHQLKGILKK